MEEKIKKLPKWAQDYINMLISNNKTLTKQVNEISGEAETDAFIQDFKRDIPLPSGRRIAFQMKGRTDEYKSHNAITVYIREYYGKNVLDINGSGQSIKLLPQASNAVYIELED